MKILEIASRLTVGEILLDLIVAIESAELFEVGIEGEFDPDDLN